MKRKYAHRKQVNVEMVINLYKEGLNMSEIGRRLGHDHNVISHCLSRNKIPKVISKKSINKGCFQKGHIMTKEMRRKISKKLTGVKKVYKNPEAHRKMMIERNRNLGEHRKGKKRPPFSEEWKRKISKSCTRLRGENSRNWKGGVSGEKGYHSFQAKRRKLKKLNNGGLHTLGEWENLKAQYNWTCPACKRKEPKIKLTEDHIIPLSKGGSDNIENIQPLCRSCNCKKGTRIIIYNRQLLFRVI